MSEYTAPPTAEENYAAAIELIEKSQEKPAEAVATESATTPQESPAPAGESRTRNADGTFAPKGDGKTEPAAEKEPFAGFNALPDEAKREFNRIAGRAQQLERDHKAMAGKIAPLQRELQSLRTRAPAQSAVQNRQQAQATLDKWDAHAKAYPEDAEAIAQHTAALRAQLEDGLGRVLTPLEQRLQTLESREQAREQERRDAANQEHLNQLADAASFTAPDGTVHKGDNWKQIAGMEDENGNPIPREQQAWHPEFVAWVDGHKPAIARRIWEDLKHPDVEVVGSRFAQFNAERFGMAQGNPVTNISDRRAANLLDVTPNSAGRGKPIPPAFNAGATPEDQWAQQMEAIAAFKKTR